MCTEVVHTPTSLLVREAVIRPVWLEQSMLGGSVVSGEEAGVRPGVGRAPSQGPGEGYVARWPNGKALGFSCPVHSCLWAVSL